jgi:hypothetical protein
MGFDTEPTFYEKTILSDLQGAWQCLREEVAEHPGFESWERALFHIDEAMSWESVRNLRQMQRSLILVRNLLHGPELEKLSRAAICDFSNIHLPVVTGPRARYM